MRGIAYLLGGFLLHPYRLPCLLIVLCTYFTIRTHIVASQEAAAANSTPRAASVRQPLLLSGVTAIHSHQPQPQHLAAAFSSRSSLQQGSMHPSRTSGHGWQADVHIGLYGLVPLLRPRPATWGGGTPAHLGGITLSDGSAVPYGTLERTALKWQDCWHISMATYTA